MIEKYGGGEGFWGERERGGERDGVSERRRRRGGGAIARAEPAPVVEHAAAERRNAFPSIARLAWHTVLRRAARGSVGGEGRGGL